MCQAYAGLWGCFSAQAVEALVLRGLLATTGEVSTLQITNHKTRSFLRRWKPFSQVDGGKGKMGLSSEPRASETGAVGADA